MSKQISRAIKDLTESTDLNDKDLYDELMDKYKLYNKVTYTSRFFIQTISTPTFTTRRFISEDKCSGFSILVVFEFHGHPVFMYLFFTIDFDSIGSTSNDIYIVDSVMKLIGDCSFMIPVCMIISDIHGDIDKVIIANEIRNAISPTMQIVINGDIPISSSTKFRNYIVNPLTYSPYTMAENTEVVMNEITRMTNYVLVYGNHDKYLIGKTFNGIRFTEKSFHFHYIIQRPGFVLYISHSFVNNYDYVEWNNTYTLYDYINDYKTYPKYYFPQSSNLLVPYDKPDFDYKTNALDRIEKEINSRYKGNVYMIFGHTYQYLYMSEILRKYPSQPNYIYYTDDEPFDKKMKYKRRTNKFQASDSPDSGRHSLYGGCYRLSMIIVLVVLIVIVVVTYYSYQIHQQRKPSDYR